MDDPHDHAPESEANLPAPPGSRAESELAVEFTPEAEKASAFVPASVEPQTERPRAAEPTPKVPEIPMATNYEFNKSADAAHQATDHATKAFGHAAEQATHGYNQAAKGVTQAADQFRAKSEDAVKQGQAVFAQATEKSREVMDKGMKALDEFSTHARGNVDAMTHASKAATQGIEQMVQQIAEITRKSFEQATAAMRTMASARTPQDVFTAQNDFIKAQFDNFVGEYSKLTETVMKVSNEVIQPLQNHMTETAKKAGDAVKGMVNTGR